MTSVSMDLKQIYLRLQLYFPFERKKSDVPQFSISMVAVPSRASQTKRGHSTSTDDNLPRFQPTPFILLNIQTYWTAVCHMVDRLSSK